MELLYRLGARWRNPSLFPRYRLLKETEGWSLDRLRAYQTEQCRKLLRFADEHSPYYHDLFRKMGFQPGRFQSLEDLEALPLLDKKTLLQENARIHTDYPFRKTFPCETSGTTGQVLTFRRDEAWDSANRAALMRGYSWYDVKPWDRNIYLWGFNIERWQRLRVRMLDILQNRFRVFSYDQSQIQRLAKHTRKAVFLHGYSSMIYEIAKAYNEDPHLPPPERLKLVKGTSEKIFDAYQEAARKAFGRRIISEYGAAEAGLIAFECPQGKMHVHMEGCYVEEVEGEVVVTNLLSFSFPIIRYRLGDSVDLAPEGYICPCGMEHEVIEDVLGRVGQVVYGKEGRYPSLTFYYVFKNLFFEKGLSLSYQARQEAKGEVLIDIEQDVPEVEGLIREELDKNFGSDLEATIRFGQTSLGAQAKRRDFLSLVDE